MSGLSLGLTRRRALAGVIYLFTQKSVAYRTGRIPHVLANLKQIVASAVKDEQLIDEIYILYRQVTSTGEGRTMGRVRFQIDWKAHELLLKGAIETIAVDSESMLEEVSPALVALAEFIRAKSSQSQINDLKFYLGWTPEILSDKKRLEAFRQRFKTAEMSEMDIGERTKFESRRTINRLLRPKKLSENAVTLEWVDVYTAGRSP